MSDSERLISRAWAWHPVKTEDAGWIWLRAYWRVTIVWIGSWGYDDYAFVSPIKAGISKPLPKDSSHD